MVAPFVCSVSSVWPRHSIRWSCCSGSLLAVVVVVVVVVAAAVARLVTTRRGFLPSWSAGTVAVLIEDALSFHFQLWLISRVHICQKKLQLFFNNSTILNFE